MIIVGENINIMSKTLGPAMRERHEALIKDMAAAEDRADVDYLDLNIGPAKRQAPSLCRGWSPPCRR